MLNIKKISYTIKFLLFTGFPIPFSLKVPLSYKDGYAHVGHTPISQFCFTTTKSALFCFDISRFGDILQREIE